MSHTVVTDRVSNNYNLLLVSVQLIWNKLKYVGWPERKSSSCEQFMPWTTIGTIHRGNGKVLDSKRAKKTSAVFPSPTG